MAAARFRIRPATAADAGAVAGLAAELAQSFAFSPASFGASYPALLAAGHACLLVATAAPEDARPEAARPEDARPEDTGPEQGCLGYLLGFEHLTFYANGRVGWVEEVLVRGDHRGQGAGRALMTAFEEWARQRDCALVALATRRAAPFYRALGYQDSATYLRKVLAGKPG
jgi:GNAT superfamily N-acetyltransferase